MSETVNLEELESRVEKLSKAWEDALTKIFRENIYNLIEETQNVETIIWCNYANYWNDGDPCPFRARTESALYLDKNGNNVNYSECSKIGDFLVIFPDTWYEKKFGGDTKVIVKRNGSLEVQEYTNHS